MNNEKPILERLIDYSSKIILYERDNIRKIKHAGLSAYTSNPLNLVLTASSSEGKTYLILNSLKEFPFEDLLILKGISPKTFTREHGELALWNEEKNKYETRIINEFKSIEMSISEYKNWLKSELAKKPDKLEYVRENLSEEYKKILDDAWTLVLLKNKILVFLDTQSAQVLREILAVLSHDTYYTRTKFVEGEGTKRVKNVVFEGFPAIIYATSYDADLLKNPDINTRFEILEPTQTLKKYSEALQLTERQELGLNLSEDLELEKLKGEVKNLTHNVKNAEYEAIIPLNFEGKILFADIFSAKSGAIMRRFKAFLSHIKLEALFNADNRLIVNLVFKNGKVRNLLIINMQDILTILELYLKDYSLQAEFLGLPKSTLEFFNLISLNAKQNSITGIDINLILDDYVKSNPNTALKSHKMAKSRYLKQLKDLKWVTELEAEGQGKTKIYQINVNSEELELSNKYGNTGSNKGSNNLVTKVVTEVVTKIKEEDIKIWWNGLVTDPLKSISILYKKELYEILSESEINLYKAPELVINAFFDGSVTEILTSV